MLGFTRRFGSSPAITGIAGVISLALVAANPDKEAHASTFTTLHSFCKQQGCPDGDFPTGGLAMDSHGNLFGTTRKGGAKNLGVIFELLPNGDGTWKEKVLYSFCALANCSDGSAPTYGGVLVDASGNLYGTTCCGGSADGGVAFELQKIQNGWTYKVRYDFCGGFTCPDGSSPLTEFTYVGQDAGTPWNGSSPLYATAQGGSHHAGVAYQLTPGSAWSEVAIHNFRNLPTGALAARSEGDLFGTTQVGGKYGSGVLYKLAHDTWQLTILHNFCNMAHCPDGVNPEGRLVIDSSGNRFGVTQDGGAFGEGVAFEYSAAGGYDVIYNFCNLLNCNDGRNPGASMILDGSGNLYGTTQLGGKFDRGVLFKLHKGTFAETVLHDFCHKANCSDGQAFGPVILDGAGNFFGEAQYGRYGSGTVYEFTP